jgi:septal ring factor EnvC (AmiA/AmiB activator)
MTIARRILTHAITAAVGDRTASFIEGDDARIVLADYDDKCKALSAALTELDYLRATLANADRTMQDPNDTPAATAAGDTVALLRDTAAMAPALKRLLIPRGASAEGWDDWQRRIEATADRLDAAERERELLAETARRLTDERDAARKTRDMAEADLDAATVAITAIADAWQAYETANPISPKAKKLGDAIAAAQEATR